MIQITPPQDEVFFIVIYARCVELLHYSNYEPII